MEEFTPWVLLTDAGLLGALLAVGAFLRARFKFFQSLMIPAAVLAGFLGLILGPNVLGILPFSDNIGTYSSVLIVVVFATMAITDDFNIFKLNRSVASFGTYGVLIYAAQVAVGMLAVLVLLKPLFGVDDSFGVLLFAGWAGGFGSAAAVGSVFEDAGSPEVYSLAFTSATVGLLIGIIGGQIMARVGAATGAAKEFAGLQTVPEDMRTGVLNHDEQRPSIGTHTFSGASVESLAFQVGVVAAISAGAYAIVEWIKGISPALSIPVFAVAFILGLLVRGLFRVTNTQRHLDKDSLQSVSGTATDFLVTCGIASIVPTMVSGYVVELTILFAIGLALCLFLGLVVAPRMMPDGWFERQLFTWGWATGAVSTGIALLRIVDPKMKSGTLEEFGLAYIPVVPVEISAVSFVPILVIAGASWAVVGIWGTIAILAALVAVWLIRTSPARSEVSV